MPRKHLGNGYNNNICKVIESPLGKYKNKGTIVDAQRCDIHLPEEGWLSSVTFSFKVPFSSNSINSRFLIMCILTPPAPSYTADYTPCSNWASPITHRHPHNHLRTPSRNCSLLPSNSRTCRIPYLRSFLWPLPSMPPGPAGLESQPWVMTTLVPLTPSFPHVVLCS